MIRRDFVKSSVSILAAPILARCGRAPGESELGTPRLTARPGTPTLTPELGLTQLDIAAGPTGVLYVPTTYTSDVPAPLFVALHGAGGSASNWESYHGRAESRGMIFLAIDSLDSTWDLVTRGLFGPDVERLDRALQYTFDRCNVTLAKIALGGFSDGASYALSLGISNGDLFSHLIGYSLGFVATAERSDQKPLIYVSHGTRDNILPITNSRDSVVPGLRVLGYDVTFNEFDGGHEVPAAVSESALDWLLAGTP